MISNTFNEAFHFSLLIQNIVLLSIYHLNDKVTKPTLDNLPKKLKERGKLREKESIR